MDNEEREQLIKVLRADRDEVDKIAKLVVGVLRQLRHLSNGFSLTAQSLETEAKDERLG